jgi:MATE family multidrug resistance protein
VAILRLAWPLGLSYVLKHTIFFVSLAFCGHIYDNSSVLLDSAGLAISFINITGFAVAMGLSAAMDTLASQAWGAKSYLKVGIYLQRGILVFALAMLPVYALWVNIESVLNLLQQPPCVVEQAKDYIHVYSSCLPALFLNILLERYLQVQNIVYPLIITGVIANVVNIVAHCLFVLVAKWGIRGAGASTALSMYALTISLLVIIFVGKLHKKTWGGWSREALKDWGQFARYGIPGFVMLCVEWWSIEMGFIVTGTLRDGEIQQGMHAIIINYATLIFMVPFSLSIAGSIRVGNELGAGRPNAAKHSFLVGLVILFVWLLFIEVFTVSLKDVFVKIFTSDTCLLGAISTPLFFYLINVAGDHSQGFLSGVVRGCGRQLLGSVTNFFSYAIGVTVGCVLVFIAKLGVTGYWLGLTVSMWIQTTTYLTILLTMSWKKQSAKARKNSVLILGDSDNGTKAPSQGLSEEMVSTIDESFSRRRIVKYNKLSEDAEVESVELTALTSLNNHFEHESNIPCENDHDGHAPLNGTCPYEKAEIKGNLGHCVHEQQEKNSPAKRSVEETGTPSPQDEPKQLFHVDDIVGEPLISVDDEDEKVDKMSTVVGAPTTNPRCRCLPVRIVLYRLVLLLVLLSMFLVCLVVSQLFVYNPLPCNVNMTIVNGSNNSCVIYSILY